MSDLIKIELSNDGKAYIKPYLTRKAHKSYSEALMHGVNINSEEKSDIKMPAANMERANEALVFALLQRFFVNDNERLEICQSLIDDMSQEDFEIILKECEKVKNDKVKKNKS